MNSYNPLITRSFLSVTVSRSNWTFTPISSTSTSPGPRRRVEYARRRYGYTIDPINLANLENELLDIKRVLDEAMPEEWANLIPPELSALKKMAKKTAPFGRPKPGFYCPV